MRSEHFNYMIEIDRLHSISAASRTLYIGQTTLSAIVKNVEKTVGFEIFSRTSNGVVTTEKGKEAIRLMKEIDEKFESLYKLRDKHMAINKTLNIYTSPSIGCAMAVPFMKSYLGKNKDATVDFKVISGEQVAPSMIQSAGNIGVTYFNTKEIERYKTAALRYQIDMEILGRDCIYVLVSKDHPLASRDSVEMDELREHHLVLLSHFSAPESSILGAGKGSRPASYTIYPTVSLVKDAVLSHNAATCLSGYSIFYDGRDDLDRFKVLKISSLRKGTPNEMMICLLRRQDSSLKPHEKEAIVFIKEFFAGHPLPELD